MQQPSSARRRPKPTSNLAQKKQPLRKSASPLQQPTSKNFSYRGRSKQQAQQCTRIVRCGMVIQSYEKHIELRQNIENDSNCVRPMSGLLQYRMVPKSAGLSHRIKISSNDYINTRYVKVHNSLFKSCTKGEGCYLPCDLEMTLFYGPFLVNQINSRPTRSEWIRLHIIRQPYFAYICLVKKTKMMP